MRPNRLRELMKAGKPSVGTNIMVFSPDVVEILGYAGGYDYVEVEAEYMPYDLHDLDNLARAMELHNIAGMIKIDQEPRTFVATRAIGSGIQNILFADVRTVEDVKECVTAVRAETPQTGGRHGSGDRRFYKYFFQSGTPDYVQALEDCVVALMIEKRQAVENLDAILEVPGVDMVVFGGNDYSMSIGRPGQARDPEVQKVQDAMIKKALAKGVHPRVGVGNLDAAKRYLDMGVRHFSLGTDLYILYDYWKRNAESLRGVIEGR